MARAYPQSQPIDDDRSPGEWQTLRFQEAIGRLTATSRIRQIRKDIARIHTIRTERVMDEALRQAHSASR